MHGVVILQPSPTTSPRGGRELHSSNINSVDRFQVLVLCCEAMIMVRVHFGRHVGRISGLVIASNSVAAAGEMHNDMKALYYSVPRLRFHHLQIYYQRIRSLHFYFLGENNGVVAFVVASACVCVWLGVGV
jgi:hypothetical protein